MKEKAYIQSLENALILMCNSYEGIADELYELAKEGNEAFLKVPLIQGTSNVVSISQIGKLKLHEQRVNLKELKEEILKRRERKG